MVESRLRHLVIKLEYVENLTSAHPFIKGFEKTVVCYNEQQAIDAGRGIFHGEENNGSEDPSDMNAIPTNPATPEDTNGEQKQDDGDCAKGRTVNTTTFYVGLAIEPKAAGTNAPRKLDISWPTSEFTKMCKQWEKYDEKSMGICVKYIKRFVLKYECLK